MADYISQIQLPNNSTYDFRDKNLKLYTGSCATAAGTAIKDVTTDGAFTLEKGAIIFVNFTSTNSAAVGNLKLKINGEADANAKPIKYLVNGNDPANIPGAGYLRANQTYMFRYDGTNWVADLNYYTYSNDFASRIGHYNNILARKAIAAESLIVGDETGYEKVASGVTFNLAYPIVWCTSAVNVNASNYANMFLQHYDRNIATGAKSGFTSTANKAIYLIVTLDGNIATIDSNIITDTLPSSDDGKVYISLGKLGAQSTGANYFFLYPVHPMFWYKNGAIREYSGASEYALAAPLSGISGADDLKAIEALSGTTGLLKKTAANTWTLDTNSYVTSSGVTNIAWDGTNHKLTKTIDGTTSDVVTINTLKSALNLSASDIGLSNALHFIGITSTTLTDGATTSTLVAKSTNSLSKTTGFVNGDVVMDGDQLREYVWSGSAWRLLGITTSSAYTQPATTATNTWIAQVSQGTDGKITATTGTLDTSGTWSGTAAKATAANLTTTQYGLAYYSNTTGTFAGTGAGTSGQYLKSNGSSAPTWATFPTTLVGYGITDAATSTHVHGDITNDGKLTNANRLVWTDANKKVYAGYHWANSTKVAINSSSEPTENFYVSGTVQFNIGTSDTTSNKRLKIVGNGRFLSFGGSGIMAYNTSNGTDSNGTLALQYSGGNVNIGNASNTVDTTIHGSLTLPTNSTAFNFSGIGAASDNVARNIWFSYNGRRGTPVYDDDFKYNPSTNTITIGTGTLSATNYSGNAATVTVTTHTNTTNGNKTYYLPFLTATSGSLSPHAHSAVYLYETVSSGAISKYDFCFGASAIQGSITLWDGSSHWGNIKTVNLSANRTYDLPNQAGTFALLTKTDANALINLLDTGSSDLTANDYVITQYVGGGTTTTTYHRRPASKVVNATLVKAALGTVSTTAKKFLKDTGSWAKVDWGDLTNVPTTFAPSTHNHDTVGRERFIAYPSDGFFNSGSSSISGYIRIKIPKPKDATMFSFDVDIYSYNNSKTLRYHIGGYNFNDTSWYNTAAYCIAPLTFANSNLTVRFLTDDDNNKYITIGETNTTWAYPKIAVHNILLGSGGTNSNWSSGWTVNLDTTAFVDSQIKSTRTDTNIAYKTAAAKLTTTSNAIAYYTDTAGTFGTKASANGALYATSTDGTLNWGTLPVAQGGTGATAAAEARTNLGLGSIATYGAATAGTKDTWGLVPVIGASDGVMEIGKYIDFHTTDGNTKDYDVRITAATTGLTISGTTSGTFSGNLTGNVTGNADTATAIQTAGTTAQFYRGDNSWSNIIKQTANAVLGIDTNLKIGTARKDLNFDIANGSGTGINDGYAGGITWGLGTAAYAGIYYQTSGNYGSRLIFGTTGSYANGAYARMIIQADGKIGINTLSPDSQLHVSGITHIGKIKITTGTSDIEQRTITTTEQNLILNAPASYGVVFNQGGTTKIRQVGSTFYPEGTTGTLGTDSNQWFNVYSDRYTVTNHVTIKYNSTDQSLDFIFS